MGKKLKVGFIMGGGVSMGSFSAGALQYVMASFENNLSDDYDSCEVDIFTGASAGSVTLTLAIFDRLKNKEANREHSEHNNWLKKVWTSEEWLDINSLAKGIKTQDKVALFSDEVIQNISKELKKDIDQLKSENKGILADTIYLGMTMTNLNGIKRNMTDVLVDHDGISSNTSDAKDAMINYASADYRYFKIKTSEEASDQIENRYNIIPFKSESGWAKILETAIASGAFPGAFPSVKIERDRKEYGRHWPYQKEESQVFTYSDGGAFNNDPIDHAMHMAGEIDKNESNFERLFIFIDPIVGEHKDRSQQEWINQNVPFEFGPGKPVDDIHEGLKIMVAAYMRVLMHQGSYKHFNKVDKVNNHLQWLETLIGYLSKIIPLVPNNDPTIKEIRDDVKKKLQEIVELKYQRTQDQQLDSALLNTEKINHYIDQQIQQIIKKYPSDIPSDRDEKTDLLLYLVALLENISGLRNKQKINLIAIGADNSKVLGNEYEAFKGFFNYQWRKYDYQQGKIRAHEILENVNNKNKKLFKDLKKPPLYQIQKNEEILTSNRNKRQLDNYMKDLIKVMRKPLKPGIRFGVWLASGRIRKKMMNGLNFERKDDGE